MSVDFSSSKYSIDRAKQHLVDFERQIIEFVKTEPYILTVDVDSETSEKVHKIKLIKPMPHALPGIAADAVNNLRSALDQAIFAVTSAIGANRTYFPFSNNSGNFVHTVNGRCKELPQEITTLISAFKPYKGGNDMLWAINELSNTNKHAIVASTATTVGGITISEGVFSGGLFMRAPVWDRSKNEAELFRQPFNGTAKFDIQIATFIVICDVDFLQGRPALEVFNEFVSVVESIIRALEAECARLGI